MPTLKEGLQTIRISECYPGNRIPCWISNNRFNKKRVEMSYTLLGSLSLPELCSLPAVTHDLVDNLDLFCKGFAEAEDLQEVCLTCWPCELNIEGGRRVFVSTEVVSKFNLALSLNPNLQHLSLDHGGMLTHCLALPTNADVQFQNLQFLSIHNVFSSHEEFFHLLAEFLSRCPELHHLALSNCGLASVYLPASYLPNLHPLGDALLKVPNLRTLNLEGNSMRWLSDERFEALYNSLSVCRRLENIIGIQAFKKEHQDRLRGLLRQNYQEYIHHFIRTFSSVCELAENFKQLILEFTFSNEELSATIPTSPVVSFSREAALLPEKNEALLQRTELKSMTRGRS